MQRSLSTLGEEMYGWATDLWPIVRSLTGPGVRETLAYVGAHLEEFSVVAVPSGTAAFDWTVPNEWTIRDAHISDDAGNRIVDFKHNNLHVVGYSEPVDTWLNLEELNQHLHSLPDQPDAIPYITSYYSQTWGFCLTQRQRNELRGRNYHIVIDSDLKPGVLNYGELILPGREDREILLSTYICHPSMANNELSGPVVTTALARWLAGIKNRRYTYRIVFLPETIGSIVYLSKHLDDMRQRTEAGFVVTCVGDDRAYSFLPSRRGGTVADRVAEHVLSRIAKDYVRYSFLDRGSDERQYCSPGIDLPVVSIMRSKYGVYPEYHTSLDNLSLISPQGLESAYNALQTCIRALEENYTYIATNLCEPQLGKRGLYPSLSTKKTADEVAKMMNLLTYADGNSDLLKIAEIIDVDVLDCAEIAARLEKHGLLKRI